MYQDPSQAGGMQPQDASAGQEPGVYNNSLWNQQSSPQAGGYASMGQGMTPGFGQQARMDAYSGQNAGQSGFGWQQQGAQPWQNGAQQNGLGVSGPQNAWPQYGGGQPGGWNPQPQQESQQGAWPQMPLNGTGPQQGMDGFQPLQPQNWQEAQLYNGPTPNPKRPFNWQMLFIIISCGVIPVLFIITMLLTGSMRTLSTILLSLGAVSTVIAMWYMNPFGKSTQMMITVLYVLALAVAVIMALPHIAPDKANTAADPEPTPTGAQAIGLQAVNEEETETPTPAPQQDQAADESEQRLRDFLDHWKVNDKQYMVNLCAPSWQRSLSRSTDALQSLFTILQNRKLIDYELLNITGTNESESRTVTIMATIDRQTGSADAVKQYQMSVIMVRENESWYVNPKSLQSYEPTPAPTSTSSKPTQPPTPAPATESTLLYYNPDGGKYYHVDPNCPTLGQKYKPLKSFFYYAQINEGNFRNLLPCGSCGAPSRPK